VALVELVKELVEPVVLKPKADLAEQTMALETMEPMAHSVLVVPEARVHFTVAAEVEAATSAVAVEAPTKTGAAPMLEAVVVDPHTPMQHS
jgi:hypothetical protein